MTPEQKFNCVFCNEYFCSKEDLQIHFRKHGDPNFNKNIKSKTRLNDSLNFNEKLAEDNEMVGCDVCDEVFPTISKAITHKHKVHPEHEAKYFCPFCGKLFTMKHLYNKHIQTNHDSQSSVEKSDFHCDSCEVMFNVPSAMMYHNKFFHRQDPDLPGIGGSKKVKLCSQEMIQLYYCAFCGEEYNNKINLQKHVGEDHGDENQKPTDILKCPLCEAMFYHLDAYELHLMFHTSEDMYSENNEMAHEITEFSLETVPPIAEKIQEEHDQGEPEGMENFLQLLLDEPEDNSEKLKTKKHKKHKKSKKAAITLDEFFNMNKDVFGDGLDVQGIEEVPTQVVLKKIQGAKTYTNKKTINADINKLKKQGITVKTKSGNNVSPIFNSTAFNKTSVSSNIEDKRQNVVNDPEDLISKLMRQGNSQIKIVKRSAGQIVKDDVKTTQKINDSATVTNEEQSNDATNEPGSINQIEDKAVIENTIEQDDEDESKDVYNCTIEIVRIRPDDNDEIANDQLLEDKSNKSDISDCCESVSKMLNKSDTEEFNTDISQTVKNGTDNETSELSSDKHDEDHLLDLHLEPTVVCNDTTKILENESSSNKTIGALKHLLNPLITIKPVKQGKSNQNTADDNENQNVTNKGSNISNDNLTMTQKQNTIVSNKTSEALKNLNKNLIVKSITNSSLSTKYDCMKEKLDEYDNNVNSEVSNSIVKTSSDSKNLLMESSNQNEIDKYKFVSDVQNQLNINNTTQQTPNAINQNDVTLAANATTLHIQQKKPIEKSINNEIEIVNIDDSDSEDDTNKEVDVSKNIPSENTQKSIHLQNVLQNLGTNITIKSSHQKTNEIKSKNNTESQFPTSTTTQKFKKVYKPSLAIQKSINLQNTLKNLGSHITIKSKNTSSIYCKKEHTDDDYEYAQSDQNYENDSDSEEVGKVKITEATEEGNDLDNDSLDDFDTNPIVQSPGGQDNDNDSQFSENSDFDDYNKESGLENLDRPVSSVPENMIRLNKDLVIKSINDKRINPGNGSNKKNSTPSNNGSKSKSPQTSGSSNQMNALNRKTSTSANEVNAVKSVKIYQTETVIQEITTVTKTIRTVNESSNESVVQAGKQTCVTSQKFSRTLGSSTEHQGKIFRHVAPTVGTKVRTLGNVRPTNMTPVRTPNQVIPIRSIANIIPQINQMQRKTLAPGVQTIKNIAPPAGSPQRQTINKPKMSPHVTNQTTIKRPLDSNSSIVSSFKKSKEFSSSSPTFLKCSDTPMEQFSASTSRSEYSNVTKIVKGNSLKSTSPRSEVSTQQQLSRLSNMSGLKIMKTSTKQSIDVAEKNEVCASKRNALEALVKLQKHGLLIKKPCVEIESNKQESSGESDDENFEQ